MGQGERMPEVAQTVHFAIGEGSIDPATRVAEGKITDERIDECVEALRNGEFYLLVTSYWPTVCVDGRPQLDGGLRIGANAAGGTYSLVLADALTTGRYHRAGQRSHEHAKQMIDGLKGAGVAIEVGDHADDHAGGANCGCGACDKLDNIDPNQPSILKHMVRHAEAIRGVVESLGIAVTDVMHAQIAGNAIGLVNEQYASSGQEMRQTLVDEAGESATPVLTGAHKEIAAIFNMQPGMTLDRQSLAEAFGEDYQVFNVDVWALEAATRAISVTAQEAHAKFVAALYYNIATAGTLAGASLRPVVRSQYQGEYQLAA